MPLHDYGVLKGRPINKRLGAGQSPHYQVHIIDDTTDYRIAVNVKSKLSPSELLFIVDEHSEDRMYPMQFGDNEILKEVSQYYSLTGFRN